MSLCLNMIVKNESHIIEKTLENLCQYFPITYWVISDTGSSDNTIEIIEAFFKTKGIAGHIHEEPWKNFSYNRNEALKQCEGKSDYILIFDADDYVQGELILPELTKDAYLMQFTGESGSTKYFRKLIVRNNGSYQWQGVLHEYMKCNKKEVTEEIKGNYVVVSGRKGSRNFNKNKYIEDAEILEAAFLAPEDPTLLPRYAFYCAQSYRDAGMVDKSIEWYKKRIAIPSGWKDEIYCSYIEVGLLLEKSENHKEAIKYWQKGVAYDPNRAECWYHLARRYSWDKNAAIAYVFARKASKVKYPEGNRLFIQKNIYQYWSYYEWCKNAYKIGKIEESYTAFKQLVEHCPQDLLDRVAYQIPKYRKYIANDSKAEINELSSNLKRVDRMQLINNYIVD